jgi:hypothetical protein
MKAAVGGRRDVARAQRFQQAHEHGTLERVVLHHQKAEIGDHGNGPRFRWPGRDEGVMDSMLRNSSIRPRPAARVVGKSAALRRGIC